MLGMKQEDEMLRVGLTRLLISHVDNVHRQETYIHWKIYVIGLEDPRGTIATTSNMVGSNKSLLGKRQKKIP